MVSVSPDRKQKCLQSSRNDPGIKARVLSSFFYTTWGWGMDISRKELRDNDTADNLKAESLWES